MCGIIGYNGTTPCIKRIFSGLQKLEYRGYDSSGIAVLSEEKISVIKKKGKLSMLAPLLDSLPQQATIGMGHTRWATHGVPSTQNAHPHLEAGVSIIHNGILENYKELKISLLEKGVRFQSETDSEVIVHLMREEIQQVGDVKTAILNILGRLEGAFALGILTQQEPDQIYVVKNASPIVLGVGNGENFFASDVLALLAHTNRFIFLEDGDIARISRDKIQIWNFQGQEINRDIVTLNQAEATADKGGYRHYMLKEIHEQPSVLANTIHRLTDPETMTLNSDILGLERLDWNRIKRIHIVACGTAYYAGLTGKYQLEPMARMSVDCELASEFRYRKPWLDASTLLIAVTQSGETADTLACVKHAKQAGCQTYAICNVPYSSIPRESGHTLYMEAGPEVGVASTKAFTSMALNFWILSLELARIRGFLGKNEMEGYFQALRKLPNQVDHILSQEGAISDIAGQYFEESNCLFLGRGCFFPIALEGALKLKEISYIHAEGYAAGELKHGPIALIDRNMPVIALASQSGDYEKTLSNLEEVAAREGRIIAVGQENDSRLRSLCQHLIPCPRSTEPALQAIISTIPLQLFAYYVAVLRGTDVDQPRNLAKSVTVE